jgi:hypothetical protein
MQDDIYTGDVEHGEPHGSGKLIFEGGEYEGQWFRGHAHGPGKLAGKYFHFEGMWNAGTPVKGSITLSSGTVCSGEFLDGLFHGRCDVMYPDGVRHEGFYEAGMAQGQGQRTFPNGDIVDGMWEQGVFKDGTFRGEIKDGCFTNDLIDISIHS